MPVFTTEQAAAGRAVYTVRSAGYHLPDLLGCNEASPLAGVDFMSAWRGRAAGDLAKHIQSTTPTGGLGSLSPADESVPEILPA